MRQNLSFQKVTQVVFSPHILSHLPLAVVLLNICKMYIHTIIFMFIFFLLNEFNIKSVRWCNWFSFQFQINIDLNQK